MKKLYQSVLTELNVTFDARMGEAKLRTEVLKHVDAEYLKGLEEEAKALQASTEDDVPEADEEAEEAKAKRRARHATDAPEVEDGDTMLCTVKHNGVYYKQGKQYTLEPQDQKHFKENGWI